MQRQMRHSGSQSSYVSTTRRTSETLLVDKSRRSERKVSTIKVEETIIESQMEEFEIKKLDLSQI